mmetsp:Transcript_27213/g.51814  ORF Transcript_27213/g.51814 Transcript_27213/m.51814 type:complete len:237 (+) Transcript_27213:1526-2236(+)
MMPRGRGGRRTRRGGGLVARARWARTARAHHTLFWGHAAVLAWVVCGRRRGRVSGGEGRGIKPRRALRQARLLPYHNVLPRQLGLHARTSEYPHAGAVGFVGLQALHDHGGALAKVMVCVFVQVLRGQLVAQLERSHVNLPSQLQVAAGRISKVAQPSALLQEEQPPLPPPGELAAPLVHPPARQLSAARRRTHLYVSLLQVLGGCGIALEGVGLAVRPPKHPTRFVVRKVLFSLH